MVSKNSTQVITIDGPAGAGKSTVAKLLAKKLGFFYLDTGAMYRALTLKAIRLRVDLDKEDQLVGLAEKTTIDFQNEADGLKVFLDGEDVTEQIRTTKVTNNTFYIARLHRVREIMVKWQRAIGEKKDVVVEGRDVGTVVFPKATKKFYLDADFEERSQRRIKEYAQKGHQVNETKLKRELNVRDHKDLTRRTAPLKKADDALFIDSTHLSIDEVVEEMLKHIHG